MTCCYDDFLQSLLFYVIDSGTSSQVVETCDVHITCDTACQQGEGGGGQNDVTVSLKIE